MAFPRSVFRPLIGVDAAYVFGGQGAWLPQLISNKAWRNSITGVNVGFLDAHVGFELGSKNVAFTLQVIGASRAMVKQAVPEALGRVGLQGMEKRMPHELSGGA